MRQVTSVMCTHIHTLGLTKFTTNITSREKIFSTYRKELHMVSLYYFVGNFLVVNKVNCLHFFFSFFFLVCNRGVIRDTKCFADRRNPYRPVAHTLDSIWGRWKALCFWYVVYLEIKHFSVNATALQNLTSYKTTLAIISFLLCVPGTLITSILLSLNQKHIKNSTNGFQEATDHTKSKLWELFILKRRTHTLTANSPLSRYKRAKCNTSPGTAKLLLLRE